MDTDKLIMLLRLSLDWERRPHESKNIQMAMERLQEQEQRIKTLESMIANKDQSKAIGGCDGCEYKGSEDCPKAMGIGDDVYCPNGKLISNQAEKAAKIEIEGGGSSWWFICSECHGAIDTWDKYCKHCGKPLVR